MPPMLKAATQVTVGAGQTLRHEGTADRYYHDLGHQCQHQHHSPLRAPALGHVPSPHAGQKFPRVEIRLLRPQQHAQQHQRSGNGKIDATGKRGQTGISC